MRITAAILTVPALLVALVASACGGSQSSAPHYVVTNTFWSGACESVSTFDPETGDPVHFERCLAVAELRNDGSDSQDPVLDELPLVRAYDVHGILLPERCDEVPTAPKLSEGATGRLTCHFIALAPDQIDTSRPPVVTIENIAEEVQKSSQ